MSAPSSIVQRLPVAGAGASPLPPRAVAPRFSAQSMATRLIPQLRYQLTRVGLPGIGGVSLLLVALAVALAAWLPAHNAVTNLRGDLLQAHANLGHGAGMTATDANRVIATLPNRAQAPAVLAQILQQADEAGIALDQGRYSYRPPQNATLGRYSLDFPVKGEYPRVRDFIGRTLNALPAVAVEKLHIERKAVGDSDIRADIEFVLYVRGD